MSEIQGRAAGASVQPPLSQAVGYVIVVVLGLIIAGGMFTEVRRGLQLTKQ